MKIHINTKNIFNFILPVLVFLTQWFSFAGINLSWVLSILLLLLVVKKLPQLTRNNYILLFAVIVLVCPIANLIFSKSETLMYSLYISIVTGLVFMLYILSLNHDTYEAFVRGVVFSCILFALWGLFEIHTGNYLVYQHEYFTVRLNAYGKHYPGVLFTNTNDLAQYLVLIFSLVFGYLWKKNKVVSVITSVAILLCAYHAGSRLSMICLVLFFALSLLFKMLFVRNTKGVIGLISAVLAISVVLIIVESRTGMVSFIIDNYLVVDSTADYTTGRSAIYAKLIDAAKTLPLGGFGTSYSVNTMPPHNLFLFILCDYGWIPAILFVVLLIKMFATFWRSSKHNTNDMIVFTLASLCIFPIMSCISSTNEQRKVIWLFLGMILRIYFEQQKVKKVRRYADYGATNANTVCD